MRDRYIFLFIPMLLVCLAGGAFAQEYSYAHYDVREGLPVSTVYCMAEGRDGFIWFGTEAGLSRFDGARFTNFTTADGLPDNDVLRLFVDSRNRVWMTLFKNAVAYYWKGKIYSATNDSMLAKLNIQHEVSSVVEDGHGNIAVQEKAVTHIIDTAGHITNITEVNGASFGSFYIGTNSAHEFEALIFQTVKAGYDKLFFADLRNGKYVPTRFVPDILTFANGTNFVLIKPGLEINREAQDLVFYSPTDRSVFRIPIPKGFISVCSVNDSNVAINSFSGAYLVNIIQKKITDTFLKEQTVNWMIEDGEGDLWLSVLGQGVFRLGSREFRSYFIKMQSNNLPVFSILKVDSLLYIGSSNFLLNTLGPDKKQLRSRQVHKGETTGRIMSILKIPREKSCILGTDAGTFFADKKSPAAYYFGVKSLSAYSDSELLLFAAQGVETLSTGDLRFSRALWPHRSTCGLFHQGSVYIGALGGLYKIDSSGKTVFIGEKQELLRNRISGIAAATDGMIWIATYGQGLVGLRKDSVVAHLSQSDGLTSNLCRSIFVLERDIWIGTDKGLNKIVHSGDTYSVTPYTSSDGLNSDVINAVYVEGKQVYAGTSAGLTAFDESRIASRSECKLHFTTIRSGDLKWSFDTTDFVVPKDNRLLQFEFSGISFRSAGTISYQFRLNGLDNEWHSTRQTFLNYPSLPYGKYDLEMYAINKFAVRSETRHVRFVVEKLFFEKTWVRICLTGLLIGLVWILFIYRLRRIRKSETEKAETAAKIADLEQTALRSQMNPHFIFNCLNSIQEYVIDKDIRKANEFITKFSYLIRQTLDLSSKPLISLEDEINYISTYMELEIKRFGNKFVASVMVSEEIDKQVYHIPPMILQPYIENAIRHGIGHRQDKKGRITISMRCSGNRFLCSIEDNGVGRRKAHQYKSRNAINYQSKGMTLVAKRIDMLNKTNNSKIQIDIEDMEDKEGLATGTRIVLNFPLDYVVK